MSATTPWSDGGGLSESPEDQDAPEQDDDRPVLRPEVRQAELPVEYRLTDAYLAGYTQGFREGRHGRLP